MRGRYYGLSVCVLTSNVEVLTHTEKAQETGPFGGD